MLRAVALLSLILVFAISPSPRISADEPFDGSLELVSKTARPTLAGVTSVEVSKDGRYLYAAAWQSDAVNVFSRDLDSGELTHLQEIVDDEYLDGAVALRLSSDGKYAVATSFQSGTVCLFQIAEDGQLDMKDVVVDGENDVAGLDFAIDATFSKDGKFVYCANGRGIDGISTIAVEDDKLRFIETNAGIDGCLQNARAVVAHPDGETILVAGSEANSLVVFDRDAESGTTDLRQIIEDDDDFVLGIEGIMGLALSEDGRFVYSNSGRFRGDSSVGTFEYDKATGRLDVVQELSGDDGTIKSFAGGNEILCAKDGLNVYALATRSSAMACFTRDIDSGKLKYQSTLENVDGSLAGAAGICISPDDRYVYVAAENSGSISVFRRSRAKTADGSEDADNEENNADENNAEENPAEKSDGTEDDAE